MDSYYNATILYFCVIPLDYTMILLYDTSMKFCTTILLGGSFHWASHERFEHSPGRRTWVQAWAEAWLCGDQGPRVVGKSMATMERYNVYTNIYI